MAGDRDEDRRERNGCRWQDDDNFRRRREDSGRDQTSNGPFSAFKRFVDDNFNALSEGFKNFPSNIAEIRENMKKEQDRRKEEELDISRRWTGSTDSPDHIQLELLRSTKQEKEEALYSTLQLLAEAEKRNRHVPADKIVALFEDKESTFGDLDRLVNPLLTLGGAWFYMPETGDKLPSAEERSLRWFGPTPRWLSVDWFKRSPYSPIRLEAHPDLGNEDSRWRAAFEDLINASLGKPMGSEDRIGMRAPHGCPQSTHYGPGLEWMLSLQCRGILPPILSRFYADWTGKDALRSGSVMDSIFVNRANAQKDLPWSNEHSLAWCSALTRDLSDLTSEIAVKATGNSPFTFKPRHELPETTRNLYDLVTSNQAPGTEQDLYESVTKYQAPVPIPQPSKRGALDFTGDREEDLSDADYALWEALDANDAQAAARVLSEWHKTHGDLGELISGPLLDFYTTRAFSPTAKWFPVLNEALRRSDISDRDFWKAAALSDDAKRMEEEDKFSIEEKRHRAQIVEHIENLSGRLPPGWSLASTKDLERRLERMEGEYENLQRMVGEKSHDEPVATHKPGVLSALTTTQTTRLPDGTVTTKVVLKKRFVDGREETSESVHTMHESLQDEQDHTTTEQRAKKKGWFWS